MIGIENNSSGIRATTFATHIKFLYKSVAFFFERSLELAHQTLKPVLVTKQEIKKQSIQRFGSAETNDVCTKKPTT